MERTLVLLKPDAVKRKLVGKIISRFEKRDLNVTNIKLMNISMEIALEHYSHVRNEDIFDEMIKFMISGPVVVMIIEGYNVIRMAKDMTGKTKAYDSPPGTIRGDYGSHGYINLIHTSDCPESAEIEISRFFGMR